jgi:Na+-translocating ferredoxin:NAD+ oxidoreductase RNF subunit RnfB
MEGFLVGAGIMTGLASFFGVVLAVANKYLKVYEDPRIDVLEGKLPGSNCGACGQPGCRAFAETLVNGTAQPAGCTVSSPEAIADIAKFLGVSAGSRNKVVARLHCAGGKSCGRPVAGYEGMQSCRAAFVVNGGGRACAWGCLGVGDCEIACTFDAIQMNDDRLPVVDTAKCTACGDCVAVCPLNLFTLEPLAHKLVVQCSTPLTGEAARAVCTVACDACGRCAADAGPGVIEMRNGLPTLRLPAEATREATFRCPTGAIQWVDGDQFKSPDLLSAAQTSLGRRHHG